MAKVHLHFWKLYFKTGIVSILMLMFFGMIHISVSSNDGMEVFISRQEVFPLFVVYEVVGVISTVVAEF